MPDITYYTPKSGEGYVYLLTNPLKNHQPFYVGVCLPTTKNKSRSYQHLIPSSLRAKTPKNHTIRKILNAGDVVGIRIAFTDGDRLNVLWVERFLVALYGRVNTGTGCLTNLTEGGEGQPGVIVSPETREKHRLRCLTPKGQADQRHRIELARTPEAKARLSATMKRRAETPEGYAHLVSISHGRNEEDSAKMSACAKRRSLTDEGKSHIEKIVSLSHTPEHKAKQVLSLKKYVATEQGKAHLARMCESNSTPEARAKQTASMQLRAKTEEGHAHLVRMSHSRTQATWDKLSAMKRKLNSDQADTIRSRAALGEKQTLLAVEYNVCTSVIANIVHKRCGY